MTNGGGAGVMAADAAALAGVALARARRRDARGARRRAAADLVARQPDRHHRRRPGRALHRDAAGAARRPRRRRRAVPARADGDRAQRRHRARLRADRARRRGPRDGVLARRRAVAEARSVFAEAGVADYETPEEAVRAFAMLGTYRRNQALLLEAPTASENGPPDARRRARGRSTRALAEGREHARRARSEGGAARLRHPDRARPSRSARRPTPRRRSRDEARLSGRAQDPFARHQPQVRRRRRRPRPARRGRGRALPSRRCWRASRAALPEARLDGFTVQQMVRRPLAQELIVGASVDPLFGPVLLFGQGGTAVEVIADRAIALPPLNRVLAARAGRRARASPSCSPATATIRRRGSMRSATC